MRRRYWLLALATVGAVVGAVWAAGGVLSGRPGGAAAPAAGVMVARNAVARAPMVAGAATALGPAAAQSHAAATAVAVASGGGSVGSSGGSVLGRRIVETAALTVRVAHIPQAFSQIGAAAVSLGGYIQSSNLITGGRTGDASATLVLEVPHAQYGVLLKRIAGMGHVRSTTVSGRDVTAQYVDLQGRIRALSAERQSYLTLLGHATSVGDILRIQSALTGVESQLESLTGQLRVLTHLSAMATVTVTLLAQPVVTLPRVVRPIGRVGEALTASLQVMERGGLAAAQALAWILPWAAMGLGAYAAFRLLARRRARV